MSTVAKDPLVTSAASRRGIARGRAPLLSAAGALAIAAGCALAGCRSSSSKSDQRPKSDPAGAGEPAAARPPAAPYAALDAQTREAQQTELLRIWRERRPTILFVTHDIAEAAFLAERVVIFGERGAGIVADVRTQPELEEKIARDALRRAAAGDRGRADALAALLGRPVDTATIEQRGPWIREQPEFYELTARLKGLLPAARPG
ncbi:hypothetical protein [Sorangium sp. So ce1151]|uniref:hypothetical protein n=1 Tax=Sorangium sp. So ce1151 TaxID=3133332 RepID=UPI003F603F75